MSDYPNPGSSEAVRQGCLCPILKNNRGREVPWLGVWWVNVYCPLHGTGSTWERTDR